MHLADVPAFMNTQTKLSPNQNEYAVAVAAMYRRQSARQPQDETRDGTGASANFQQNLFREANEYIPRAKTVKKYTESSRDNTLAMREHSIASGI